MKKTKKEYTNPKIEIIVLDSEISLVLESPPPGPNESIGFTADFFERDPYNSKLV